MKSILFFVCLLGTASCMKGKKVDLIVHNARIHTMDDRNTVVQAMAIRDGKIVETGPERQILNKYSADEEIDAGNKDIIPGITDAHGHLMSYARQKLSADLVGTTSFDELIVRTEKYGQNHSYPFVIGRGWDQSLWKTDEMPDNSELNAKFPDKPVLLYRIDGHAALANEKALEMAGITPESNIPGGEIVLKNGKPSGLLIDNAVSLVADKLGDFSEKQLTDALLEIQDELLQYGITSVHEAGVHNADYQLLRKLSQSNRLKINLYVMLFPETENFAVAKKGIVHDKNFTVRSFKVMGDGALGSHGALLKQPYSDYPGHGLLTTSTEDMKRYARLASGYGYQLNVHAIGDSTAKLVLEIFAEEKKMNPDHRWRIEHAQIIDPKDYTLLEESGAFLSVQPTHAVSDQRWAETRLGKGRMKGAYAYKSLLQRCGMIALGTDFPVENTNPWLTVQAAVNRRNAEGMPAGGFYPSEALTLDECLKGMTLWPAYASFSEATSGSLEKGKDATFVMLEFPLRAVEPFESNYAAMVFIRGRKEYDTEE